MKKVITSIIICCSLLAFPVIPMYANAEPYEIMSENTNCYVSDYPNADYPITDYSNADCPIVDYSTYLSNYKNSPQPKDEVNICFEESMLVNHSGYKGLLMSENNDVNFSFILPDEGLYSIMVSYVALQDKQVQAEFSLFLNEKLPFTDAENLTLTKVYIDDKEIRKDNRGNELRPHQTEFEVIQTDFIHDPIGYEKEPYSFYFEKGENKITLKSIRGSVLFVSVKLTQNKTVKTYNEYLQIQKNECQNSSKQIIMIDAEKPKSKSHPTLYADCDRFSADVHPNANTKYKLNYFGGNGFNRFGQWVEYEFEIYESGFYILDIRYKQNYSIGTSSYRRLYIDDEILYDSLDCVEFPYYRGWNSITVGGKQPQKIYLDSGIHTIKIYTVLGSYREILQNIEKSVSLLNRAYRESIMYLGAVPDIYRDYDVEENLPEVLDIFKEQIPDLSRLSEDIKNIAGIKNDKTAIIDRLVYQLKDFIKNPDQYPKRLERFRNNISAFSSIINTLILQPLAIDYLVFYSPDISPPDYSSNILGRIVYRFKNLLASFYEDYNLIGDFYENANVIDVWIISGRDQANIIKRMSDDDFTSKKEHTGVNLKLVRSDAILPAIVAKIAPDVIINLPLSDPVNYAFRGAVYDISKFNDFPDIIDRFSSSSLLPLTFGSSAYGLPETQNFNMMFFRKDILEELNIDIPDNWNQTINVIAELKKTTLCLDFPGEEAE